MQLLVSPDGTMIQLMIIPLILASLARTVSVHGLGHQRDINGDGLGQYLGHGHTLGQDPGPGPGPDPDPDLHTTLEGKGYDTRVEGGDSELVAARAVAVITQN
jgi:hypothetical protein